MQEDFLFLSSNTDDRSVNPWWIFKIKILTFWFNYKDDIFKNIINISANFTLKTQTINLFGLPINKNPILTFDFTKFVVINFFISDNFFILQYSNTVLQYRMLFQTEQQWAPGENRSLNSYPGCPTKLHLIICTLYGI